MSSNRFSFFSYGTVSKKAAVIVGCGTEVWLAEAVGLVCWLIVERLRLAWKHTDAFGVLFWSVHVEMKEEVFGRRHILHLMLVWHLSDFRYPNYFQRSEVVRPFFSTSSSSLSVSSHSVLAFQTSDFLSFWVIVCGRGQKLASNTCICFSAVRLVVGILHYIYSINSHYFMEICFHFEIKEFQFVFWRY